MGTLLFLPVGLVHEVRKVLAEVPNLGPVAVAIPRPELERSDAVVIVKLATATTDSPRRRAVLAVRRAGYRTVFLPKEPDEFYVERCMPGSRACLHCNRDVAPDAPLQLCCPCHLEHLRANEPREYDRTAVLAEEAALRLSRAALAPLAPDEPCTGCGSPASKHPHAACVGGFRVAARLPPVRGAR